MSTVIQHNQALAVALELLRAGRLSIDRQGRIWRHQITSHGQWRNVAKRRAENVGGKGYLRLTLQIDGKLQGVGAHKVVWAWHRWPLASWLQINHKDLNKQNNRLRNLEPATQSQNILHSYANGRKRPHPWAHATEWRGKPRLTAEQREEIKRLRRETSLTLADIGACFGIKTSHTHRICKS